MQSTSLTDRVLSAIATTLKRWADGIDPRQPATRGETSSLRREPETASPPEDWLAQMRPVPPEDWLERVRAGAPGLLSDRQDESVIDWHAPEALERGGMWPEDYPPVELAPTPVRRPEALRLSEVRVQPNLLRDGQSPLRWRPSAVPLRMHERAGDAARVDARIGAIRQPQSTPMRYCLLGRAERPAISVRAWVQRAGAGSKPGSAQFACRDRLAVRAIRQAETPTPTATRLTVRTMSSPDAAVYAATIAQAAEPSVSALLLPITQRPHGRSAESASREPLMPEHLPARTGANISRVPAMPDPHQVAFQRLLSSTALPASGRRWPTLLEEEAPDVPTQTLDLSEQQARFDREQWGSGWNG